MSDQTTFIVNSEPPELRIAEIRNGRLFDILIERGDQSLGGVYRGVISNIVSGLEAFFVDIGLPKKGLLHFKDVEPVQRSADKKDDSYWKTLRVGQPILVQIARPAVGSKGPRLSTRISLPGRYMVLVAPWDAVGVSRRIDSEHERERLRAIASKIRPLDYGLIVRTEAEGMTEAQLQADLNELISQIESIKRRFENDKKPALIHRDLGLLGRTLRDRINKEVSRIVLDSAEDFSFCREIVTALNASLVEKVELYEGEKPIFEHFGVERALQRAQQKTVTLPHGGSIVIEETEALTAVDVNSGKFVGKSRLADTVIQINLEAVEEVALQLRLRGIGGVIVVDFIDMERTRDRIRVLDALEAALKQDRAKTHIVQLSPSGLVEITRRREGLSLRQLMNQPCAVCAGDGVTKSPESIAIQLRRHIRQLATQHPQKWFKVRVHPEVACCFLDNSGEFVRQLEETSQIKIVVKVDQTSHIEATHIEILPSYTEPEHEKIRVTVGTHDRLFPKEAPEFTVWNDLLVLLPSGLPVDEPQARLRQLIVLEVEEVGRWFATAKIARPALD